MSDLAAGVVIVNGRHEVCLQLREDFRVWAIPAGGKHDNETYEACAIREAREETGYEVELVRHVGDYWRPQFSNGRSQMRIFTARVVGGDPSSHDWESLAVCWFAPDQFPRNTMRWSREIVSDALANHTEPVQRIQTLSHFRLALFRVGFAIRSVRNLILRRD